MNDGRLPLVFTADLAAERRRVALVLTRSAGIAGDAGLIRYADAAARAQAGGCACCRTASHLVAVLRQLVIDRARGKIDFATVVVDAEAAAIERLAREARADPVIAAHYAVRTDA